MRALPLTRIEYLITRHCLDCHLPGTGPVLDAGSGPGRYAIDLAQRGYRGTVYWRCWELFDQRLDPEVRASGIVHGTHTWYTFATGELEALVQSAGLEIVDRVS